MYLFKTITLRETKQSRMITKKINLETKKIKSRKVIQ